MTTRTAAAVLLTVEGLHGCIDLELSGDRPISEWLPHLLTHRSIASAGAPQDFIYWALGRKGGHVMFDASNTLFDYDVVDGTVLSLLPRDIWHDRVPEPEAADPVLPHHPKLYVIKQAIPSLLNKVLGKKGR